MRVICLFRIAGMLLQVCRLGECIFVFGCLFGGIFVRLICKNLLDLRTLHLFRVFFFFLGLCLPFAATAYSLDCNWVL